MHDFGSQIGLEYKLLPEIHQVDSCIRLLLEEKVSSNARRMRCAAGGSDTNKRFLIKILPQPSIAQLSAIFTRKKAAETN